MRTTIVLLAALTMAGALAGWLSGYQGARDVAFAVGAQDTPLPLHGEPLDDEVAQESGPASIDALGRFDARPAAPPAEGIGPQTVEMSLDDPLGDGARASTGLVAVVEPRSLDLRVIQSGHSLTDPLGQALTRLVRAAGGPQGTVALSTIPGSPMDWRWNHRTHAPDARADIASFDVLVLTERVSLSNTRRWHNSDYEALRWARHAWTRGGEGRGAEVLLYASWITLDTGTGFARDSDPDAGLPWRERLDREFVEWEAIMAHVNAHRPENAPEMRMIPATLVLAAVHDAIAAGRAPARLSDIRQLFSDDIHLTPLGAWLVALTHYTVIYARDPRGLPGPDRVDASPQLVAWLQALVWDVVTGYPGSGVRR